MIIKCVDFKFRNFQPADCAYAQLKVKVMKITRAYCTHCNEQFTIQPSIEQKETWRKHTCSGHVYGSAKTKSK